MARVAHLALLLTCLAPTAALRLPPRVSALRQEHRAAAVALAVSAALATTPLAAGALGVLDAAPTLTIAVVCDSSGRCTKPPGSKGAAPPPLSAAEKLKKDSLAQAERLKKDAAKASTGGTLMCAGLAAPQLTALATWRLLAALRCKLVRTSLPLPGKEAQKSAAKLTKDAKKALPVDPNPNPNPDLDPNPGPNPNALTLTLTFTLTPRRRCLSTRRKR